MASFVNTHQHDSDIIINCFFASDVHPAHAKDTFHRSENDIYVNLTLGIDFFSRCAL